MALILLAIVGVLATLGTDLMDAHRVQFLDRQRGTDQLLDGLDATLQQKSTRPLREVGRSLTSSKEHRLAEDDQPTTNRSNDYNWETYQDLPELFAWIDSIVAKFPDVASTFVAGESYEQRPLKGVRISHGPGQPVVFVEAGIHASEWAGVTTATFFINQLLTADSAAVRQAAEAFDWYILPSTNPDGYNYAHTTKRKWRKTRTPSPNGCYGTDPNRNWDYHWAESGSSADPCSEHYAGPRAFSEPETRSLSEFLRGLQDRLQVYISLHTYKQALMFPYGVDETADNYQELMEVSNISVTALSQRYGTEYTFGSIFEIFGSTSGSSLDWVKKRLGVRFVFVYELRDTGHFGLLLPEEQIRPTAEETCDSILAMLREVRTRDVTLQGRGAPL